MIILPIGRNSVGGVGFAFERRKAKLRCRDYKQWLLRLAYAQKHRLGEI